MHLLAVDRQGRGGTLFPPNFLWQFVDEGLIYVMITITVMKMIILMEMMILMLMFIINTRYLWQRGRCSTTTARPPSSRYSLAAAKRAGDDNFFIVGYRR